MVSVSTDDWSDIQFRDVRADIGEIALADPDGPAALTSEELVGMGGAVPAIIGALLFAACCAGALCLMRRRARKKRAVWRSRARRPWTWRRCLGHCGRSTRCVGHGWVVGGCRCWEAAVACVAAVLAGRGA